MIDNQPSESSGAELLLNAYSQKDEQVGKINADDYSHPLSAARDYLLTLFNLHSVGAEFDDKQGLEIQKTLGGSSQDIRNFFTSRAKSLEKQMVKGPQVLLKPGSTAGNINKRLSEEISALNRIAQELE